MRSLSFGKNVIELPEDRSRADNNLLGHYAVLLVFCGAMWLVGSGSFTLRILSGAMILKSFGRFKGYKDVSEIIERMQIHPSTKFRPSYTCVREDFMMDVSADELLVGDLISIKQGDYIPADCLLVSTEGEMTVQDFRGNRIVFSENPFLHKGAWVKTGSCKALVCAIGLSARVNRGVNVPTKRDQTL